MKIKHDPFPRTPDGFHNRVEACLLGLERRDAVEMKTRSRRIAWVAVTAALLALALGTAVAVVQGNVLRTRMAAGGEQLAAQVQDIHMTDARDGFSFTVDELLREGDALYLSYTATVPEDGRIYFFSPVDMRMGGEPLACTTGLETDFFANLYALGGEYGSSVSQVMELRLPEGMGEGAGLDCACAFLLAEKPLQKLEDEALCSALLTEGDAAGNANRLMRDASVLYYYNTSVEGDPAPVVYLHYYPEIHAIYEKKGEDRLDVPDLEDVGIASELCTLELSMPMQEAEKGAALRNDVMQHIYFMDGYTIEVRSLRLSHFEAEFEAIIRSDDAAFTEWTEELPFGQYYSLCNADGSDFGRVDYQLSSGDTIVLKNGKKAYCVSGSMGGVFPIDGLNEIYLAPFSSEGRDMRRAIRLMPIRNPKLPEAEERLENATDPAETDDLSS